MFLLNALMFNAVKIRHFKVCYRQTSGAIAEHHDIGNKLTAFNF